MMERSESFVRVPFKFHGICKGKHKRKRASVGIQHSTIYMYIFYSFT